MKDPIAKIGVLGSSRIPHNTFLYSQGYEVGVALGSRGFTVVTGGGEGFADSVTLGALEGGKRRIVNLPEEDDYPMVGLFRYSKAGQAHVEPKTKDEKEAQQYLTLVDSLFDVDGYIFLPGGYGTQMELLTVLHAMQTGQIERRPCCVVGTTHQNMLMRFTADALKQGYISNDEIFHSFYKFPINAAHAICGLA